MTDLRNRPSVQSIESRSRRHGLLLTVLLLTVGLAGCGGGRDQSSLSEPERGTSRAPSDERQTVTTRGYGSVRVGMSLAEARKASPTELLGDLAGSNNCGYVHPADRRTGVSLMITDGRIVRIDVNEPGVTTPEGIGVGSDERDIQAAYGSRVRMRPHPYDENGHYLTVTDATDSAYAYVFETDGAKVTSFRGGASEQVAWIEGCA